jgi:hypothetical protein
METIALPSSAARFHVMVVMAIPTAIFLVSRNLIMVIMEQNAMETERLIMENLVI